MDPQDLEDRLKYIDPDEGPDTHPSGGESDLDEEDDDVVYLSVSRVRSEEGVDPPLATVPYTGEDIWHSARASTLCRYQVATDLLEQRVRDRRAWARTNAELQSFYLGDTFIATLNGSSLLPPLASQAGGILSLATEAARSQAAAFSVVIKSLGNLSLWLRGACISVLPPEILDDISHLVWNFFCATLHLPQTRSAFEAFIANPVSSPEEARFRLPGIGPMGPPRPHGARPFFAAWGQQHYNLVCDDDTDIESAAATAICLLESTTQWVVVAPFSDLPPVISGDVSRTAWELVVASLRIPQFRKEFEFLCSHPLALREAAGLLPQPSDDQRVFEVVTRRPHPRRDRRRARP